MDLAALLVLSLVPYFVPSIVAVWRGHLSTGAIIVLNLLLGWTFLGWVAALVWAFSANTKAYAGRANDATAQLLAQRMSKQRAIASLRDPVPTPDEAYREKLFAAGVGRDFLENATTEQLNFIGKQIGIRRR